MRKSILMLMLLVMAACSKVPAGHVGVKVYLLGGDKGVDSEILGVGRYWIGWNQELHIFPTYKVTKSWTKSSEDGYGNEEIEFQTKEGLKATADVGMTYSVDPAKVNVLFQTYRKGMEEITQIYLRGYVRDILTKQTAKYEVTDVYGPKKEEIIETTEKIMREELAQSGILIDRLYWIGSIRLPEGVQAALNSKIEATQRALQRENEVQEARAQAEKKIAEARGEAESLRLKGQSLSIQNIEFERLSVQRAAIEKWNGQLPQQMIPDGSLPFLKISK